MPKRTPATPPTWPPWRSWCWSRCEHEHDDNDDDNDDNDDAQFTRDSIVDPRQSEWFGWFSKEDHKTMLPLQVGSIMTWIVTWWSHALLLGASASYPSGPLTLQQFWTKRYKIARELGVFGGKFLLTDFRWYWSQMALLLVSFSCTFKRIILDSNIRPISSKHTFKDYLFTLYLERATASAGLLETVIIEP